MIVTYTLNFSRLNILTFDISEIMSVTSLRFAHTEGHCNINYVPNTKVVATCGADGEVRVFTKGITEDDSNSHLIGDEVYAMACTSQNKVYVAPSGTNTIRAYTLGNKRYNVLTRMWQYLLP